ncbi:hypothetical protein [Saccharibacillus alkalitolerans]|uniref:Uncharacterized protein n=1 Tax=Saccharibacillus alkalitolerans TaxID=2705290 RepID=A0ABX0FBY0_9BACL|nr:hypothetical protein [Saccharibacillus alkalitolerans]NGZ77058.1 hypothetical protein [Saccharibacillus alkalitolerans]
MLKAGKRIAGCVLALALLGPLVSIQNAEAAADNRQPIYKAQADFLKTNKMKKEHIGQSYRYDINNDGTNEIIITGWNREMIESVSAIGVYSAQGKPMFNRRLSDGMGGDYWLVQTRRIHNPTYKNVLAAEYVGGAVGGSRAQVFVWKNDKLVPVLTTERSETALVFKDLNGDKSEEIIGKTPFGGKPYEGSYHHAPMHKFIYKWNKSAKAYDYRLYLNEKR